ILRHIFPDLHLLIAGTGPDAPNLEEMIDRLQIPNVHLLRDSVPTSDLLATADLCWIPGRSDTGIQVALEAMAHGRAVIASDVPSLRELIRDGETGSLIAPGDPVALARSTRRLLRDQRLRDRLGQAARVEVADRFSQAKVADRWLAL